MARQCLSPRMVARARSDTVCAHAVAELFMIPGVYPDPDPIIAVIAHIARPPTRIQ